MDTLRAAEEPEVVPAASPRLCAQVYAIALEESRYIIYAPLRRVAFIGDGGMVRLLAELEAGGFDGSADPDGSLLDFLRQVEIVDAGPEQPPEAAPAGDPMPVAVTLLLTTACNLHCTYCYASAGDAPPQFMTLETAQRGIDFVVTNAIRQNSPYFEVAYHGGGEPAVHWSVLTGSLEYARRRAGETGLQLRSSLSTNGVLSDEHIDWVVAHFAGATVSCDGLPAAHDRHRVTPSGQGSSRQVMHTLRRFDEAGFHYGIRLTATADDIPLLPASVEFLYSSFRPDAIQIEPVYQLGRGQGEVPAESEEFIAAFRAAQERAAKFGHQVYFSAARLNTLTGHFCAASRDGFCLSPRGNVTACYEACSEDRPWAEVFFYGEPDPANGGYRFDSARLEHLRAQAVVHREHCRACFARWNCGGDCYYKALALHGAGHFCGAGRCRITRELTKDQLLAGIAASGGLVWRQDAHAASCAASAAPPPEETHHEG